MAEPTNRRRSAPFSGESMSLEETYRSLVESALDPMFTSDADGRYLYVNGAAAAMLGTTPENVVGKTVDELFPPHVAAQYRDGVSHVINTGETLIAEEKSEINGRPMWFSSIVQPVQGRQGNVQVAQAVVRDITRLKEAEQALRESDQRLRQAVHVAHIGIFEHDHLTDTIYLSAELRDIYGLGPNEDLSGKDIRPKGDNPPAIQVFVHPEDRDRSSAAVQRAHDPNGDGVYEIEHRHVRPDGTIRWLTTRAQTFFEGEGDARHPVRTVGAVRDITERKKAEEEREKLRDQLVQAQKMESVGRLAGGVAHDFNNMLNVINGYAELALDKIDSNEPLHSALTEIQNAARRSADLTRQLLAFARRQTVAPRVLDLNDVVAGSLKMLRRLVGEHIDQVWMPGHGLWSVRIDPAQVDQILANLAANARDAIGSVGQITIRTDNVTLDESDCARYPGAAPGRYVLLEVIDDGHGMDLDTQAHIFEPFYTTKDELQGTGLGLATVYGIVKQNEGFIRVESKLGQGTKVQIYVPRFAGKPADGGVEPSAGAPKTGTEVVLLVEDEPMVLRLSKTLLERLGYTVLAASGPSEALRLAEQQGDRVRLLVTDVVMPEMNGRDLADRLRSLYPHLKCLFLSGYFAGTNTLAAGLDDATHFLQKPFSLNDLAVKVRAALEKT
jgi:PAS domain S-box-containing protein